MQQPTTTARLILCGLFVLAFPPANIGSFAADAIDFQRDVRPLLSHHCFKCHGPDDNARKAQFRLDVREDALRAAKSGERPIVPGQPDSSELVRRIFSTDKDEKMPPPATKNPLTGGEREILKRWITEGAVYTPHWAFVAPVEPALPPVRQSDWPQNPIDRFVLARLEREGIKPSPPADRYTLIRRAYLDLTGLPPMPEEVEEFINDTSPNAFEKVVDQLLLSRHYGERWARRWLDLARYSDTNGYTTDRPRSIWPYRDWVINALNADMPFDQFTIEQIAGDMLPNATLGQRIATGFHRNTMLNEEGGIDPLEFRFYSVTDRVGTTGRVWLGLSLQCAQCHNHKFDPIPQQDFYRIFACLNNAEEPDMDLPNSTVTATAKENQRRAEELIADLPNQWPVPDSLWQTNRPVTIEKVTGRSPKLLADGSVSFSGARSGGDSYSVTIDSDLARVDRILLEAAIVHIKGPRDVPVSEKEAGESDTENSSRIAITVWAAPKSEPDHAQPVELIRTGAKLAAGGVPILNIFDDGSAPVQAEEPAGNVNWRGNFTETCTFKQPAGFPAGTRLTILIDQQYGKNGSVEHFRIKIGNNSSDGRSADVRRAEDFERKFAQWLYLERNRSVHWIPLRPVSARSNSPLLTIQDDDSVFASGDFTKSDVFDLKFRPSQQGITAVRLEALPDERLPAHGPGMAYYEGPKGDFFLGEFLLSAAGRPVKFIRATESYANNFFSSITSAALAIDGDPQTGWSCAQRPGERHEAVFQAGAPINAPELDLKMIFGRHYACDLARFRISVTTNSVAAEARDFPDEITRLLLIPDEQIAADERAKLRRQFLLVAPELASAREAINSLRKPPAYPTTMVMQERPRNNPRPTFLHKRGEFLLPADRVQPGVLSALNPLPDQMPRNRFGLAWWLVSPGNPLTARVAMNRQWAAFFGLGIVRTVDDFGYQGELPVDQQLLDWLAVEFVRQKWSVKKMHKLIVMSATYQQSSRVTPEMLARDPENRLFARGPRVRLEAELIRDSMLQIAGMLSGDIGGPSVFPPQPDGVTTEGAFGALEWTPSSGSERYRRGLYTFSKRTAPYAMFAAFDAPSGETCVGQRELSDTPLQALTILNDAVFIEAARSFASIVAVHPGDAGKRLDYLFRRFFVRPPAPEEAAALLNFFAGQKQRFMAGQLDAARVAGPGQTDVNERAAWTAVIRVLFTLDEALTKG